MSQFIYFTPEEKARAQNTDLVSLLRAQGERPVRSGREFRTPNDPSITVRGNKWFDHSARVGGYAVSFVQRYYRLPYPEAVLLLLGRKNGKSHEQAKPTKEAPKSFALPEPYGTMRRMYAYLMRQRHIDREVISYFVHEKLLYEDRHHNCVFVGLDDSGEAKHAHIRSTNSEGRVFRVNIESSASEHCFHKDGTDKSLYVFEAPIDLLSHITLYPYGWQEHSYVACCGTSIQPVLERLRQNPKLDMVYLCLDNDDAGNDACERMTDTLEDMGLDVERLCPVRKTGMTISALNSRGRRKTRERKCMAPDFAWRWTAGIFACGVFPLQELFSQQLQEQNCRRRSARHSPVGNAQGDPHDLSCGSVPSPPLAQGRGTAYGAGHHPRQHGRQKAQS